MPIRAYKHTRLMEESAHQVETAARSGAPDERLVATRVLEHPAAYRLWEAEHDRLMRPVSEQSRLSRQAVALRYASFSLLHRKALFEYLRDEQVTGARRHRLFNLFYGSRDYASSVVAEHNNYVRCGSSYLCSCHLARALMTDAAFAEPLRLYQQWYKEYFRIFCHVALAETREEQEAATSLASLKPLLKSRLVEARKAILAMPRDPVRGWREVEIRRPTGDTQKLRILLDGFESQRMPD